MWLSLGKEFKSVGQRSLLNGTANDYLRCKHIFTFTIKKFFAGLFTGCAISKTSPVVVSEQGSKAGNDLDHQTGQKIFKDLIYLQL